MRFDISFALNSMDVPVELRTMCSFLLVMLLNAQSALCKATLAMEEEEIVDNLVMLQNFDFAAPTLDVGTIGAIQHVRLLNTATVDDEDLGYWVKPRSTTWFSYFLVHECDDERWMQFFRFSKRALFSLVELLPPVLKKKDTRYRLAVPVIVRLTCTLFKLSHGASLLICSEMFAVGQSTVSIMLRQVVQAINVMFRSEIAWPSVDVAVNVAAAFEDICGLPGVMGAIDGTHFPISKPRFGSVDYFYFKSGAYAMNCQAVVDTLKCFLDLYVGMPGSCNDSRMLRRSTLFHHGQTRCLWDSEVTYNGFRPYLLGDGGYPLLPWLMVPHRHVGHLPFVDAVFNRKLSRGRGIVENAFALLKQSFRELQHKSDLQVHFMLDVVTCCAILHNILLRESPSHVESFLDAFCVEGNVAGGRLSQPPLDAEVLPADMALLEVENRCHELGLFAANYRAALGA